MKVKQRERGRKELLALNLKVGACSRGRIGAHLFIINALVNSSTYFLLCPHQAQFKQFPEVVSPIWPPGPQPLAPRKNHLPLLSVPASQVMKMWFSHSIFIFSEWKPPYPHQNQIRHCDWFPREGQYDNPETWSVRSPLGEGRTVKDPEWGPQIRNGLV